MAEIDLIPRRYRQLLAARRAARRLAAGLSLGFALLGVARVNLVHAIRSEQLEIEKLQGERSAALDQRTRMDTLRKQQSELGVRLGILGGLRGGIPAKQMFLALDRALDGDVWFLDFSFVRAGEMVERPPQAVQSGYFLVIPAEGEGQAEKAWRLDTHMEIRARASDYTALAGFVRRLVAQEEIDDVRVLETRVEQGAASGAVDFQLVISVKGHA